MQQFGGGTQLLPAPGDRVQFHPPLMPVQYVSDVQRLQAVYSLPQKGSRSALYGILSGIEGCAGGRQGRGLALPPADSEPLCGVGFRGS